MGVKGIPASQAALLDMTHHDFVLSHYEILHLKVEHFVCEAFKLQSTKSYLILIQMKMLTIL